ncbi:MAG: tRNA (5-methylaminomethyl-2-thiouridine)(34)-methyltransferase MnmD [Gammaproteobacteria bacterium]
MFENPFLVRNQEIEWSSGKPFSKIFNDRYFQDAALDEIENVFIQPNLLREKFKTQEHILVGELGFGLGVNFLYTLRVWIECKQSPSKYFEYISIEKYLPTKAQIIQAASLFPELAEVSEIFLRYYNPIHNGILKIYLKEINASLIIINTDIQDAFDLIQNNHGRITAWFLDGFDPKKNPEMWASKIIMALKQCSKSNASFGTYTSSGLVKKSFNENNIEFKKIDGFNKRHKLVGSIQNNSNTSHLPTPKKIAVIGAGIAAAAVVHALKKQGLTCDLFEKSYRLHSGASGNDAAAMYPKFQLNNSPINRFLVQSYFFSYQEMLQFKDSFYPCNAWFFGSNERTNKWIEAVKSNERFSLFQEIKEDIVAPYNELIKTKAEFLSGAFLEPKKIIEEIFESSATNIYFNHELISLEKKSDETILTFKNGDSQAYDAVILALGSGLRDWVKELQISKGHIIGIPVEYVHEIKHPIHHQGYILPKLGSYHWTGSTYEHDYKNLDSSPEQINQILKENAIFLKTREIPFDEILVRVSERVSRKNKFPIATRLFKNQNVFALGGLGSRGFSSSFLCGEVVANLVTNGFIPVDYEVQKNLEI